MTSLILSGKNGGPKSGEELLRQDTAGRVRTSKERRELLLAQFDRSGVSGARFAKMAGIKYQTFAHWLHVRRRQAVGKTREPKRGRAVTWIEAVPRAVDSLRVELPGGAWLALASREQVRTAALLLRELSGPGAKSC